MGLYVHDFSILKNTFCSIVGVDTLGIGQAVRKVAIGEGAFITTVRDATFPCTAHHLT